MPYDKTVWSKDDLITAEKLNNIEGGVFDAISKTDNFTEGVVGELLYKNVPVVPQLKTVNGQGIVGSGDIATVALGETSADAYRGDRGKSAYDHSQASGNPHSTSFADIASKPNTVKGFGITDVYTKTEIDTAIGDIETLLGAI